jgi:hypothetical protein
MSFGKSKQESGQSMDPQIKGALMNVFQTGQALSRTPYNAYQNATVAPMSPFQQQGMQATLDASRAGIGQDQMRQAIAAAQGVSGYQPSNVQSGYVSPQKRVQDVSGGMAGGQERVGASNIPTSFRGQDATVGGINTGVNAGDVTGRSANETFRQNSVNVGNVDTNIGFDAVRSGTVNDPGRIREQQQRSQDIGPLGLLGPGPSARDAQQVQAPSTINVGRVNAGDVRGIDAVEVGAINPGTVTSNDVNAERVSAAQFKDANLNDYMNQYQTGVIDSALGDIERARKMQQNQNASSAISAGAFGGDRAAILDAENNRSALEQSAKTASALRSQGFESAARLAEADLARRSDASRANQQMDMQGQLANQQSGLAASQANAQLGLQGQTEAARLGLQSGLSAQDANMQAALANQQAGLSASQSNAELGLRGGQANQQANLQAALANQQASSSDADRALRGGQINQDASLQARQQDLSRMMSNQDSQQAFALANQAQNMSAQQANAQNSLSRQQMNQDSGLRAALANQQAQLTAGQAANQGLLQTQSLGANASQANQANQFARQQLGSQASQSNQQAQLQAQLANQANAQAYGFQNQDAAMQAALANQQMGFNQNQQNIDRQFGNVDNRMRAQLANQNAGLQGAQQRLAGAGMLGQLGQDQRAMTFADAQQMQGVGNQQQQFAQQIMDDQYRRFQEQQNHPFRMFDVLRSGAGMLPNPTTTSQSSRSFSLG